MSTEETQQQIPNTYIRNWGIGFDRPQQPDNDSDYESQVDEEGYLRYLNLDYEEENGQQSQATQTKLYQRQNSKQRCESRPLKKLTIGYGDIVLKKINEEYYIYDERTT